MKLILLFLFLNSSSLFAQNAESDLQNPVIDITKIQREEWDEIPTIKEVPMKGEPKEQDTSKKKNTKQKDSPYTPQRPERKEY